MASISITVVTGKSHTLRIPDDDDPTRTFQEFLAGDGDFASAWHQLPGGTFVARAHIVEARLIAPPR